MFRLAGSPALNLGSPLGEMDIGEGLKMGTHHSSVRISGAPLAWTGGGSEVSDPMIQKVTVHEIVHVFDFHVYEGRCPNGWMRILHTAIKHLAPV